MVNIYSYEARKGKHRDYLILYAPKKEDYYFNNSDISQIILENNLYKPKIFRMYIDYPTQKFKRVNEQELISTRLNLMIDLLLTIKYQKLDSALESIFYDYLINNINKIPFDEQKQIFYKYLKFGKHNDKRDFKYDK